MPPQNLPNQIESAVDKVLTRQARICLRLIVKFRSLRAERWKTYFSVQLNTAPPAFLQGSLRCVTPVKPPSFIPCDSCLFHSASGNDLVAPPAGRARVRAPSSDLWLLYVIECVTSYVGISASRAGETAGAQQQDGVSWRSENVIHTVHQPIIIILGPPGVQSATGCVH